MKALFICLTDYQMLNAINIKINLLKNKKADILFFDNKKESKNLAGRLKKVGIFENVYLHQYTNVQGLHEYLKNEEDGRNLLSAIINSIKEIKYRLKCKIYGKKYKINGKLYDGLKINFAEYDQVFGIITKDIVENTMQLVLALNKDVEINFIEDGTSTYWRKSIKTELPLRNIYLYQPELANYYSDIDKNITLKKIPQIDSEDYGFKEILNNIFGFQYSDIDYSNKAIFFDQNWDSMPEYLKNLNGIKKIVLNNSYKKHLRESKYYDIKMKLFRMLSKCLENKKKVIVKLHPRSNKKFIDDYKKNRCIIAPNIMLPWEVIENNYIFDNNIWVTVSSTALCSLKTAFKNKNEDIKLIFLYKMVYEDKEKYKDDIEFFEKFKELYFNDVYIPENLNEYKSLLYKLIFKD